MSAVWGLRAAAALMDAAATARCKSRVVNEDADKIRNLQCIAQMRLACRSRDVTDSGSAGWHGACTDDAISTSAGSTTSATTRPSPGNKPGVSCMFERIHTEAGQVRLHLCGGLDGEGAEQMREGIAVLAAAEAREIVIDLSNVTYIDGSGLGVLSYLFKRLTARGRRLSVVGVSGQPLAMLRHLGLAKLLGLDEKASRRPFAGLAGLAWAR